MAEKVLIVDDVTMFLELEKGFLQRTAVRIFTAKDGNEALNVCLAERPALVFMDLHMPNMNGDECCKAIKRDPRLKETSVVLITSEGKEADRQLCLDAKCDAFLTKPLDRKLFLETARKLLPNIDRRDQRSRCHIKTKFRAFGITISGFINDLSQLGAYLAADCEVEPGTTIELVFALPEPVGSIIHAKGRVAWVNTRKKRNKPAFAEGFGIEFTTISGEASRELARFLGNRPEFI